METSVHFTGLTSTEVSQRVVQKLQNNDLPRSSRSYKEIFFANVVNAYNLVLISSLAILFLLQGEHDAVFASSLLLINILIGSIQEVRAKWALDNLAAVHTKTVVVKRDGQSVQIPVQEIVKDDVIELFPGEPIVVDGPVLMADSLEVDESSLTGESEYVAKVNGDQLTSGSYCAAGKGLMKAVKIGRESQLSTLTKTAKKYKYTRTPFEKWLKAVFQVLMVMMVVLGPLTVVAGVTQGLTYAESIANMVNLVSSLVPQGLIVSVMISFAYGGIRMSRERALVQKLNAVEAMGHLTMLCVDKTGTLTKNILNVEEVLPVAGNSLEKMEEKLDMFVSSISTQNKTVEAIATHLLTTKLSRKHVLFEKISEVAFTSQRKWSVVTVQESRKPARPLTFWIGAPEVILPLLEKKEARFEAEVQRLSAQGFRVLFFAEANGKMKKDLDELQWEGVGIIALKDEIRQDVLPSLQFLKKNNVGLKIISGDSAETVTAVAQQVGVSDVTCITGSELAAMTKTDFDKTVRDVNIFARISPELKKQIISSLMQQGFYTGMVGDGVNDIFALKQAHVSIAMNSGAQITKDVSDIVLLENAFAVLPKAIREGKEITQELYAVTTIFFIKIIYLLLLFLLVGFTNLDFPLSIRQTTWIAFMTVGIPTLLISFRILRPKRIRSGIHDVLQYSFLAGTVAGLAMTAIAVLTTIISSSDFMMSRTMVMVFACLFSTFILLDMQGINFLQVRSIAKSWFSVLLIAGLGFVSVYVPLWVLPVSFLSDQLSIVQWSEIGVITLVCIALVQFFSSRFNLRHTLTVLIGEGHHNE